MPNDQGLLGRLRTIVGDAGLLCTPEELLVYECDGYTVEKKVPDVVVFPTSTEQVVAVVRLCNELNVPFIPARSGDESRGWNSADRRRGDDHADADEADFGSQFA